MWRFGNEFTLPFTYRAEITRHSRQWWWWRLVIPKPNGNARIFMENIFNNVHSAQRSGNARIFMENIFNHVHKCPTHKDKKSLLSIASQYQIRNRPAAQNKANRLSQSTKIYSPKSCKEIAKDLKDRHMKQKWQTSINTGIYVTLHQTIFWSSSDMSTTCNFLAFWKPITSARYKPAVIKNKNADE